ncbi:MAG: SpoIIE family protein phosphatase [Acidobacteriaceae bacterium]|nr:SpoIIE family protein phosphatase [Acidobacteriaceae bacterium]
MPTPASSKAATKHVLYALLFVYAGIATTYQVVNAVSTTIGTFNLRNQVQIPFQLYGNIVFRPTAAAIHAGLAARDTVLTSNGVPCTGAAVWQRIRWYARPGDTISLRVRKQDGTKQTVTIPLEGYPAGYSVDDRPVRMAAPLEILIFLSIILVPLFCLALGLWVAFARPSDPNAWFVLILLTYPQAFNPGAVRNWIPDWLSLRLYWHLTVQFLAPPALFLLGLLFPERSRLDKRLPWLKWLVIALTGVTVLAEFIAEYNVWYDISLLPRVDSLRFVDLNFVWSTILYIALYWVLLFDKLRMASSPDARRRLQVLLAGSVVGLGNILIVWGLLPSLGIIRDPNDIRWLLSLAIVLMLFFPLTLAYVVIVQRAMDVRILLRMGSKYLLASTTVKVFRIAGIAALIWFIAVPLFTRHRDPLIAAPWAAALLLFGFLFLKKRSPTDLLQHWIDRKFFRESYDAEVMLSQLAKTAQTISDPAALIRTVSHRISDVLHVERLTVLLRINGNFEPAYAIGPALAAPAGAIHQTHSSTPVLNSVSDGRYGAREGRIEPESAELLVPLSGRTQLLGMMALGPKRSEAPYTPSDLRLLESVGVQTGLGLELSETAASLAAAAVERARIAREIEIAREVQERLFPQRLPLVAGVNLAGFCRTVFGVGGDYYDAIEIYGDRLGLAIGDVSGKGISAALLMASLRACLRTMTLTTSADLVHLMSHMNRLIYEASAVNRYATFFFGIFDPAAGRFDYVNAGHNPPVLLRRSPSGEYDRVLLDCGGPVIGLLPRASYEQGSLLFYPGDLLLAYTDGISEAMNSAEQEWGEEGIILAAQRTSDGTAEDIVKAIFAAADVFVGKAAQHDDMTVLVMKCSALNANA